MEIVIILIALVVIAFYIGKHIVKSDNPEIKVIFETSGFDEYDDEEYEDRDSWEGGFWEASDPKKLSAHIEIEYEDGNKSLTTRTVRVREFDNELYGGIIMGHCELRNATRTFRFDRIKKCVDLETGEIVPDVGKHLNELYEKSPERSTEILATDYIDIMKVVYFVAKADGQYRKEEKQVISNYIRKLVRDDRITIKMIDEILKPIDVPTMQGFKLALGRVLKSGEVNPVLLATCCQEIVDTQKSVRPMEKEALEYIEKKLSSLPAVNA
ncbi:MAG: hypothetical protein OQL28_05760 [Sedimenticola sp.]|nr:hypothetical protein [Sedimenticola sp.]